MSNRRQFVAAAAALSLAGCLAGNGDGGDASTDPADATPTDTEAGTDTPVSTSTDGGAADRSTLVVRGWDDRSEYEAVTDDDDGEKAPRADPNDSVGGDENTRFRGVVGEGNADAFEFAGRLTLTSAGPGGHVEYSVSGGTGDDVRGALDVEGSGFYYVVTRGDVDATDGTADAETAVRENAAAGVLTEESHQFEATGELTHVALHPTDDSRLVVTHSFA